MIKNFDDKNIVNHSKTMRIWIRGDDLITRNMTKNIKCLKLLKSKIE